jgi:hypothetical protein
LDKKVSEISVTLLELEFKGYIQALPGHFYKIM